MDSHSHIYQTRACYLEMNRQKLIVLAFLITYPIYLSLHFWRILNRVCTKLAEMAILYSKDLTTAKKLPPVGLDLMLQIITGLGVQCLTI